MSNKIYNVCCATKKSDGSDHFTTIGVAFEGANGSPLAMKLFLNALPVATNMNGQAELMIFERNDNNPRQTENLIAGEYDI